MLNFQNLLLQAMSYCSGLLTQEEVERNKHGPMLIYSYTPIDKGPYDAPEYFSPVPSNHTEVQTMNFNDVLVPIEKLVKGSYPGGIINVYYPGFPTMKHLKYQV